ncbi:MAG TPA: creatininase family protein [Terriglobia bacterium]|nr:creatininase family protein [Terriglobia bacterium]
MSETNPHAADKPGVIPNGGGFHRLAELSHAALDALDRERTVIIFTVSPLEEHGPHLPVGTDVFEAEFLGEELGKKILENKPGWTVLLGPPIPIGASAFDHAGTLLVRARTVRNATLDYGAALARHGFRYILITNAHAGPRHVVALEEAAAAVTRRFGVRMLSLSGPILWKILRGKLIDRLQPHLGRSLTPAEKDALEGDAHGGVWETSLILRCRPELVDASFARLPPMRFLLIDALRKNYPLRLGNKLGYIGAPAAATAEFGEAFRKLLVEVAWEVARRVFDAADDGWQQTSMLYKIPFFRTAFPYVAACVALAVTGLLLFWWWR